MTFVSKKCIGASPSGKATDFDSVMRWFESSRPSHFKIITPLGVFFMVHNKILIYSLKKEKVLLIKHFFFYIHFLFLKIIIIPITRTAIIAKTIKYPYVQSNSGIYLKFIP